jgi:hypothetical protein
MAPVRVCRTVRSALFLTLLAPVTFAQEVGEVLRRLARNPHILNR